ncbi:SpoIIE family protein phosphatase [Desulfotruncus arcticus]|uniref:SpoIIE family protein phosphatase n=1 Tax=Desulfotruncus arcticus TaxID=341036 RepID=UPI001EE4D559|nr:SpoIIE family protein phosphatase [Desulfotruncus arcticus]
MITYRITKNEVVHKLKNQDLVNISESISYKIDSRIERAKEISLLLAKDPQIIDWVKNGEANKLQTDYALKKINTLVADFGYTNSFIVSAITNHYWDENGKIIDTMSQSDPDDDWFFKTLASPESITIQYDYNQERKDTFVFVDALMGGTDQPIAITGVGLGLKDMAQELQQYKHSKNSNVWLIDRQGDIYLSDNVEHSGKNIQNFIPREVKEKILHSLSDNQSVHYTFEYQNSKFGLTDLIVYPLNSTQWYLLSQIPRSASITFLDTIKLNTFLASLIVLISITFFFYFVTNKLVNPYKKAVELNLELEQKVLARTLELKEKNEKLTDSIDYARRIQKSVLPSSETLTEVFQDYFLIWQPRDMVGGDFYWIKKFSSGFFVAIGDCTGHGVPGALMSMLSITLLNQIVTGAEEKPSEIIQKLNYLIKQTLKQQDRNSLTDDGLDIGICFIGIDNNLTFAGAKFSLYIKSGQELKVLKGNRKSAGYIMTSEEYNFTESVVKFNNNDLFYITSDGYIDQNGGAKNYCFGKRNFIGLINKHYQEPLFKQREIFLKELSEYMGDESQRDDITLLAFKVI